MTDHGVEKVKSRVASINSAAAWERRRPRKAKTGSSEREPGRTGPKGQSSKRIRALSAKESSERFAEVSDSSSAAYLTLDATGCIQDASRAAARLLCVPRGLLLRLPLAKFIQRPGQRRLSEHLSSCLQQHREVATMMTVARRKRSSLAIRMTSIPLFDRKGKVIGCRTTLTDGSIRQRNEKWLMLLAEVSRVLSTEPDPWCCLHPVLGLVVEKLADVALLDLVEAGTVKRAALASADDRIDGLESGLPAAPSDPLEWESLKSGRSILVPDCISWTAYHERLGLPMDVAARSLIRVPLTSRGSILGVLTLVATGRIERFVSEDLKCAEDLAGRLAFALGTARLHHQAQRTMEARKEMLALVAHDLRNSAYALLLSTANLTDSSPGVERRKTWPRMQRVRRSVEHMSRLIGDLNDLSRFESGTFQVAAACHAVGELLSEVVGSLEPLARAKGIALAVEPRPISTTIRCDRDRVIQVLSNLIGNAVRFTPPGGAISVLTVCAERAVSFTVRDSGPGMSAKERERMFDKYWQGGHSVGEGRGLGLYIAKRIVEAHGGTIWCESEPGHGAAVSFALPRTPLPNPRTGTDHRPES